MFGSANSYAPLPGEIDDIVYLRGMSPKAEATAADKRIGRTSEPVVLQWRLSN